MGLEDTEDLIEDLDKALEEAVSGVAPQTLFNYLKQLQCAVDREKYHLAHQAS